MKNLWIGMVLILVVSSASGQIWAEWTQQKKTQKKYLLQQIAASQVYLGYAREGYSIAQEGLSTIHKIKTSDFELHDAFFSSLQHTKPSIASSAKLAAIIARQLQIIKETRKTVTAIEETDVFTPEEKTQSKAAFQNLLTSCIEMIDELVLLATSKELSLKDDERLKRIDALHHDMQSKAIFCFSYSTELGLLATQRVNEKVQIEYSRKIK
jgi:hypothetical protein